MAKLNPPIVDGIILAQVGDILRIPFQMNRSVAVVEVVKIIATIKSVQNNTIIYPELQSMNMYYKNNSWWADFEIKQNNLKIGQYYKIQLAYVNKEDNSDKVQIGFYSSVGVFKYTSKPQVTIQNLSSHMINTNTYDYVGEYVNELDSAEKVYSYWFNLYELGKDAPAITSGELLHNSSQDQTSKSSTDTWTTRQSFNEDYLIEYVVKTINGLEARSPKYRITDNQTVDSDILKYYDFTASNINDGAYAELAIIPKNNTDNRLINGQFILLRSSSEDNYQSWHQLTEFILANWDSKSSKYLCRDYSVAQGVTYIYALQAFNAQGIYSKRIEAIPLTIDFEDMYLSDGVRQLCIKYNPKVTSFKNTILEAKMDTLGGKYPFFFRNGNVKYKEFPISGLISVLSDENGEFIEGMRVNYRNRTSTPAHSDEMRFISSLRTSLSAENFHKEREFKMEVLEWLTNGQPKLFRSPGEGNFLVRLMNTSLSPNDTLSRMLHTFTSTAYEIADCSFENLRKYGMLMDEHLEVRDLEFQQVYLASYNDGVWTGNAVMASINGEPYLNFEYRLSNDTTVKKASLGVTGIYEFDKHLLMENPLVYLASESSWKSTTLTYGSYTKFIPSDFSIIHRVEMADKIDQWIGRNTDEIVAHLDQHQVRHAFGKFYYIKAMCRPHVEVAKIAALAGGVYRFYFEDGSVYHPSPEVIVYYQNRYFDGASSMELRQLDYSFNLNKDSIDLQGQQYSLKTLGSIVLTDMDISYMYIGNAVYADVVYLFTTNYYTVEKDGTYIAELRKKWEQALKDNDPLADELYQQYYNILLDALSRQKGAVAINAI